MLWSYSGNLYDLSTRDGKFRTGIDALLNADESERIRERTLRGVRANAAAGRPHGKHSYAYARKYDPGTKALLAVVVVPGEAEALGEAARRVLAGSSLRSICADFDRRELPTPGKAASWESVTLKRLLLSPVYAGKRVHQGQVVGEAMWPAILDEATQARLRAILCDPARNTRDSDATRYLCSGIAKCGICAEGCRRKQNRGYASYQCPTGHVSRRLGWVDEWVTAVVLARLADPRVIAGLAREDEAVDVQGQLDELAVLRGRRDEAADAYAAGEIGLAAMTRVEASISAQIVTLQRKVRPAVPVPDVVHELAGEVDLGARWEALPLLTKRLVISTLVTVEVLPGRQGMRTFDPETVRITPR